MKKHFTEAQIAFALRQAPSGTAVAEITREMGVTEQTFYRSLVHVARGCAGKACCLATGV